MTKVAEVELIWWLFYHGDIKCNHSFEGVQCLGRVYPLLNLTVEEEMEQDGPQENSSPTEGLMSAPRFCQWRGVLVAR